ncbi:oligosaccharide flippase family protein [Candidatus Parcubacteria bacterium]|nr:oligosaccharide flippase family protein [Candidatus Parcubacteria bacterium]
MLKQKYRQHKEIIDNFLWRILQILGKQGTVFLIFFVSAKFLLPENFGLLNYLMAIIALFMIFCDFGLSSSISKYSAEYKNKDKNKLPDLLNSSLLIIFGLSFLVSFIIVFCGQKIIGNNLLLYFIPYIFLYPITSLFDGYYRGIKEFKKISIITIFSGIISILLSFVLISKYLFIGAIISQNLFFILLGFLFFITKKKEKISFNKEIARQVIKYGLVIGIINVLFFLYTKVDIIILKYFGYIVEIGYYEIVNKIFMILLIPFVIIGQVIAPNITKLYSDKKYQIVKKKFWQYMIFFSIISFVLAIFVYFIFPIILKIALFKYFTNDTILIFQFLILLFPLKAVAAIINHAHTVPTGNAKFSMWTMIPAGIANVFLDFIFIAKYGFIGVVYSTIICYIFATVSFIILYYLKLNKLIKIQINEKY